MEIWKSCVGGLILGEGVAKIAPSVIKKPEIKKSNSTDGQIFVVLAYSGATEEFEMA